MAAFGTFTLLVALVVATYAGVASLVGARRGNRRLITSGRAGVYALAAVLGLSSVALVYAFVSHDYSIKYVHHYSDAASPLFYQITAYWGGLDGSILWWVFLLSVFSAIAIYSNRNRHRELLRPFRPRPENTRRRPAHACLRRGRRAIPTEACLV